MMESSCSVLLIAVLCLSLGILQSENSFAKDLEIKPEEVVAKHLKSIGKPETLAAIKSRAVVGTTSLEFIQGGYSPRSINGQFHIVSEGRGVGIAMKFNHVSYPGEYFAFNGHDATFIEGPYILTPFFKQYHGLLEEGFVGGTLSVAWPLLDLKERQPKLRYSKRIIEGRQLHELTYDPKSRRGILQLRIRLFFDFETFRHVMTEYSYSYSGIRLLLREQFDDFIDVDGLMLPHRYTIYYSSERYDSTSPRSPRPPTPTWPDLTFIGRWTIKAEQWQHNTRIDPQHFKAN